MTTSLLSLLAVMFLTDPSSEIDEAAAAAISEDADRVEVRGLKEEVRRASITSRTSDFDRSEGVAMFEGDVVVRYSDDYQMCADRLFMFMSRSNELSRVVALGNVTISNDTRVGRCEMATYRRRKSEIEMFWDGKSVPARLVEIGDDASEISGTRIRFWLDAEQVEVESSEIGVRQNGGMKLL